MKNKILGLVSVSIITTSAFGFDYNVYGGAYAFSKIGFNNVKYNEATGKFPTDSWASIALDLNVKGSFVDGFTYGLGGMLSAPVWDPNNASFAYINGVTYNSQNNGSTQSIDNKYYVISTAYLGYEYKGDFVDFGIKGGRFDDHGLDWFSGSSEGAQIWLGLSDAVTIQLNWVNRRGITDNGWLYDFYYVGKGFNGDKNRQFIIGSIDINIAGFNIKPLVQYHTYDYIAPGLNLAYTFDNGLFNAKTSIYSLFAFSQKAGDNLYRSGDDKRLGTILIVQEDVKHLDWNFGAGIWKVFGYTGGLGTYGNPSGVLDLWTSSATPDRSGEYEGNGINFDGWALNDINAKNAFTFWLYFGQDYGSFDWRILGRITTAKTSDEQSIALQLGYDIVENVNVGLKLEWFNDISKAYERVDNSTITKSGKIRNDRSHAFVTFAYNF